MTRKLLTLAVLIFWLCTLLGQNPYFAHFSFDRGDTLRGMLRAERTCYDVHYYNLDLQVLPKKKQISGHVDIHFHLHSRSSRLQIDLFENMKIHRITVDGRERSFKREYDAVFVDISHLTDTTRSYVLQVSYEGKPRQAIMPPWDGGFVWSEDNEGNPWVGVACEGIGASLWWPNKDHPSDEADSVLIRVEVPKPLVCVANGELLNTTAIPERNSRRFHWKVHYPINNYNVTLNIADYAHFQRKYTDTLGNSLSLDYYVLPDNLDKAKQHFNQVPGVLEAFSAYFGPYPFWKDGYALVETPYLGMEHQGAIAYGNKYLSGYMGGRLPRGLNFDYIIVHETAHEYFGNSISCSDHAELWIHESFATYMEALYVEYHHTLEFAETYLQFQKRLIQNKYPLIGPYGVNWDQNAGSDIYYKGAWILHTLRNVIHNDEKWFALLRDLYDTFELSVVNSHDIFQFISGYLKTDLTPFFKQYFHHPTLPVLEYRWREKGDSIYLAYRWQADEPAFQMPIEVVLCG